MKAAQVTTLVTFNRCQYAQLSQQRCEAPKTYPALPPQASPKHQLALRGLLLAMGFELLASRSGLSAPSHTAAGQPQGSSRAVPAVQDTAQQDSSKGAGPGAAAEQPATSVAAAAGSSTAQQAGSTSLPAPSHTAAEQPHSSRPVPAGQDTAQPDVSRVAEQPPSSLTGAKAGAAQQAGSTSLQPASSRQQQPGQAEQALGQQELLLELVSAEQSAESGTQAADADRQNGHTAPSPGAAGSQASAQARAARLAGGQWLAFLASLQRCGYFGDNIPGEPPQHRSGASLSVSAQLCCSQAVAVPPV